MEMEPTSTQTATYIHTYVSPETQHRFALGNSGYFGLSRQLKKVLSHSHIFHLLPLPLTGGVAWAMTTSDGTALQAFMVFC